MSWRTTVVRLITEINPNVKEADVADQAFVTRDLGIRSMQVVELVDHIQRLARCRVRIEELFLSVSKSGPLRVGKLVAWLDERIPVPEGGPNERPSTSTR